MNRKRMTSSERRAQIVDAACRVIVSKGVHAFRLRDIAEEAGVSQPLVSSHFETREDIVIAAFEVSDERALDLVVRYGRTARTGRERVAAYVLGCLRSDPEIIESWNLWHQVWTLGGFSDRIFERVTARQRSWIDLVARMVREGQADGSVNDELDADRVGLLLITVLDGVSPSLRFGLIDVDTARDIVSNAIEAALERSPVLVPGSR
jgi:AcrR family transcriptional regulator